MSSRIREALAGLGEDVAALRLDPPAAIRARGESRHRRQVLGGTAAAMVGVALAATLAFGVPHWGTSRDPARPPVGGPSASPSGCPRPPSSGTSSPSEDPDAPARSHTAKVFMKTTSSPTETAAVRARLGTLTGVVAVTFEDRQQAWQRFRTQFCDKPDLLNALGPDSFPESFTVKLADPGDFSTVVDAVGHLPGVDTVLRAPD